MLFGWILTEKMVIRDVPRDCDYSCPHCCAFLLVAPIAIKILPNVLDPQSKHLYSAIGEMAEILTQTALVCESDNESNDGKK